MVIYLHFWEFPNISMNFIFYLFLSLKRLEILLNYHHSQISNLNFDPVCFTFFKYFLLHHGFIIHENSIILNFLVIFVDQIHSSFLCETIFCVNVPKLPTKCRRVQNILHHFRLMNEINYQKISVPPSFWLNRISIL
jgi:hypothetical protein